MANPTAHRSIGNPLKSRKVIIAIGGIVSVIGIAGMIITGSQLINIFQSGNTFASGRESLFYIEYAFLFALVGGIITLIYGLAGLRVKSNSSSDAQNNT